MKLKIGIVNLSFHHVAAAVVLEKLKRIGQSYATQTAPHEKLFAQYRDGDVDIVLGVWIPSSHGKYIADTEDETVRFSTLYTPYCIWGIPDYVDASVQSVQDITNPEVAKRFNKIIQGINEGAGISRFSRNIIKAYDLDKLGFEFKNGTISDCTNAFERAHKRKEWIIIPLWEPQYLHHSYNIRQLKEPQGLLGTVDQSTIIIKKALVPSLPPAVLDVFKNTTLGNKAVTYLDYAFQVRHKSLDEIAHTYVKQNETFIK